MERERDEQKVVTAREVVNMDEIKGRNGDNAKKVVTCLSEEINSDTGTLSNASPCMNARMLEESPENAAQKELESEGLTQNGTVTAAEAAGEDATNFAAKETPTPKARTE